MRGAKLYVAASVLCGIALVSGLIFTGCGQNTGATKSGIESRGGPIDSLPPLTPSVKREATVGCVFISVSECEPGLQKRHELTPLKYTEADARMLARDFQYLGVPEENLFFLVNQQATKEEISKLLREKVSSKVQAGDTLFVFFFGHGLGGREQPSQLVAYDELLPVEAFLEVLGKIPTKRLVLVMDACHSGAPGHPQFVVNWDVLRRAGGGLAWISSAQADQKAYEPSVLEHGVFSHFLSKVLRNSVECDRNRDGWLEFEEIASSVRTEVIEWTQRAGKNQEPHSGIVGWEGETKLLRVRREWSIEALEPIRQARIRVRFPPAALPKGERLWLLVVPKETLGRYYPQNQAVIHASDGPVWEGVVYLGTPTVGVGEKFRVVLVQADDQLHQAFMRAPEDGLVNPRLFDLQGYIKAEQTVRRAR